MSWVTPVLTYNSIKIGTTDVTLSSIAKASFVAPYNRIDIKFTPTNGSLSYYEVRITEEDADYDIGVGHRAYWDTNISPNIQYSFSIPVNSTNFSAGDQVYRVSLYAQSALDNSWDVTYLLFTVNNEPVQSSTSEDVEVLVVKDAPEHSA